MPKFKVRYQNINFGQIEDLASRAAGGDTSALAELGRLNSKYGRAANQRARDLEKSGMVTTAAYERAQDVTGREKPRFSQSKTGSAEDLLRKLEETTKFLNYQTSSVSGELKRRENVLKGLEDKGYDVGANRKAFLNFLNSDAWNEFRTILGSGDAMKEISDNIKAGASIQTLMDAYNKFTERESSAEDLLQVWDGWINATDQGGNYQGSDV